MASVGQPVADLRQYGALVFARRWLIAIITVVIALGVWIWTARLTPIYVAESRVLVLPLQDPLVSVAPINSGLSQPNLNTETQIIESTTVARRVREAEGLSTSADALLRNVDVNTVPDAEVLIIRYSDPDADSAAQLANAFAAAYLEQRTERAQELVSQVKTSVQGKIASLRSKINDLTERIGASGDPVEQQVLQAQVDVLLARLQTLDQYLVDLDASSLGAQGGQIVHDAVPPTAAANIHLNRDIALGVVAGLFLGVFAAFVAEALDRRVKSRDDIPSLMGPMIGAIPATRSRRSDRSSIVMTKDPRSQASEAYRSLATNIRQAASRTGSKVITVTSGLGGEGKTTTAANLAVALAQSGTSVVLVSGDLRHPGVHELFDIENVAGLSNALSDSARPSDISKDSSIPNLRVICSGPIPDDPVQLLSGRKLPSFLRELRGAFDFVIIDTPPVLPVADTSLFLSASDATVFVVDARRSVRDAVGESARRIEAAGGSPMGVVYNNVDPKRSRMADASAAYYLRHADG
jgi:capsular exopolysaccharide synthesis family protein